MAQLSHNSEVLSFAMTSNVLSHYRRAVKLAPGTEVPASKVKLLEDKAYAAQSSDSSIQTIINFAS